MPTRMPRAMTARERLARLAAALGSLSLGTAAAMAAEPEPIRADLGEIIGLHGWPCAEVTGYEPQENDEYVVLCDGGHRYQVYMTPDWKWGGSERRTGLKALFDVSEQAKRLTSPSPKDRRDAAERLAGIGPSAQGAVPFLVRALADEDSGVRSSAATSLGEIGPAARSAVPDLMEALKDAHPDVRASARAALGRIRAE